MWPGGFGETSEGTSTTPWRYPTGVVWLRQNLRIDIFQEWPTSHFPRGFRLNTPVAERRPELSGRSGKSWRWAIELSGAGWWELWTSGSPFEVGAVRG
jgi:hypothetical protein